MGCRLPFSVEGHKMRKVNWTQVAVFGLVVLLVFLGGFLAARVDKEK